MKSPGSPRSRSNSPKSEDETDRKNDTEETKRILKDIGNENGNDGRSKQDIDEENDVDILKEKLRKLEDNSKCSKCMVSSVYSCQLFRHFFKLEANRSQYSSNYFIKSNYFIFSVTEHLEKPSCKRWLLARTMSKMLAYIPCKYNNK